MLSPIGSRSDAPLNASSKLLDAGSGLDAARGNAPQNDAASNNASALGKGPASKEPLKEAFQDFVGQTFFSEMIKALRSTQQPSEYMHGGRTEEIFQGQLDQVLTEELSESSAEKFADPMYELFMLKRQP